MKTRGNEKGNTRKREQREQGGESEEEKDGRKRGKEIVGGEGWGRCGGEERKEGTRGGRKGRARSRRKIDPRWTCYALSVFTLSIFSPFSVPITTSEISFMLALPPSLRTNFLFDILIYCISLGPLSL